MEDQIYIKRCLELAEKGMGKVNPNPMVGCVIVSDGTIVGEGSHMNFGEAHAEVNAIQQVIDRYAEQAFDVLRGATLYVNLEPCAHQGKTPPCADLLIKHQIKKVVIGTRDPFSSVNGKGIEKLKEAGIEVVTDVLTQECREFNRRFFTRIEQQRPYIILKWAETANGFFAAVDDRQAWISGAEAKNLVHKWRSEEDAILVGKTTAVVDRPRLTARGPESGKNPLRILIDRNLEVDSSNPVLNGDADTLIINEKEDKVSGNLSYVQMEDMQHYLPQKIAYQLYLLDIQSVIIEGGLGILHGFIDADLWDEARIFSSNTLWNTGRSAPKLTGKPLTITQLGGDRLFIYRNKPVDHQDR